MTFSSTAFTAQGQESGIARTRRALVGIGEVGGSAFSATINIKWYDKDGVARYATDSTGTVIDLTVNGQTVLVDFGVPVRVSLICTAYSSGTVKASLTGETSSLDR
jgi:hypothetical protein